MRRASSRGPGQQRRAGALGGDRGRGRDAGRRQPDGQRAARWPTGSGTSRRPSAAASDEGQRGAAPRGRARRRCVPPARRRARTAAGSRCPAARPAGPRVSPPIGASSPAVVVAPGALAEVVAQVEVAVADDRLRDEQVAGLRRGEVLAPGRRAGRAPWRRRPGGRARRPPHAAWVSCRRSARGPARPAGARRSPCRPCRSTAATRLSLTPGDVDVRPGHVAGEARQELRRPGSSAPCGRPTRCCMSA